MDFISELFHNQILISAITAWLTAQVLKTLIHMWLTRSFTPERMVGSGGMPSSHSSTVVALAAAAYFEYGASSFEFAISAILAIVVMYDARGVRRETGKQAELLNDIIRIFEDMGRSEISAHDRLKELVGHTPLQVVIGALLGFFIAVIMYSF